MLASSHWKYQYFIQAVNRLIHSITWKSIFYPETANLKSRNRSDRIGPWKRSMFFPVRFKTVNYFAIPFKLQFDNAACLEQRQYGKTSLTFSARVNS
jgi:hypothetical protein